MEKLQEQNSALAICPRFDRTFAAGLKGVIKKRFQAKLEIARRPKAINEHKWKYCSIRGE
jgi:hypothetical protein